MRLYEFKKTATDPKDNIDVVVVTDGIDGQKRVFVTETPRGISVPGDQTPTPPNPNNKILEYGFNFKAGIMYEHLDFLLFAINNGFQLIQWNEGLGEVSPEELVPEQLEFDYAITVAPTTMTFDAAGQTIPFTVTSTKTVTSEGILKGMITECKFTPTITGTGFSYGENNTAIVAAANTGAQRTGTATFTQTEGTSPKSATIALTQTAGA